MAKNQNKKGKAVKKDEPMTGTMKFFLAGCVAELYLLIIRRFYINAGSDRIRIAWYDRYLWVLAGIGGAILVLGVLAALLLRSSKPARARSMWGAAGGGAFVAVTTLLVRWNMATLSPLTIVVPVLVLLGVLWGLYDRECALALTVLGTSLLALWGYRRYGPSMYVGSAVKVLVVVYLAALALLVLLVKSGKLAKLLPPRADRRPVYVACGLSAAALLVGLVSFSAAYYAMWALAMVVFALAVYYTVRQL